MTVNQSRLDTRNRGFATDGTAQIASVTDAQWVLAKWSQHCQMSISVSFEVQ